MDEDRSNLSEHKRAGKVLTPPFMTVPNVGFTSWLENRIPEYLHFGLIVANYRRGEALNLFKRIAHELKALGDYKPDGLSLTDLSSIDQSALKSVLTSIFKDKKLLTLWKPLLLFPDLPIRSTLEKLLPDSPDDDDWHLLQQAVGKVLYHQSQEATDIRWIRVFYLVVIGKFRMPKKLADEIIYYPTRGDQRAVRPSIRASESGLDQMKPKSETWTKAFWKQCLKSTNFIPLFRQEHSPVPIEPDRELVRLFEKVWEQLTYEYIELLDGVKIDHKLDTSFGITFYSIKLLFESETYLLSNSISGRFVLRSIVEGHIVLAYLVSKADPALWRKFRNFGTGQAKLVSLKLDEVVTKPDFVSLEDIDRIANEDRWEEFQDITLGNWGEANLRKMSEESGLKELYNTYYDWTSGYLHSNWACLRDSVFTIDLNPLHGLNTVPFLRRNFPSVKNDIIKLVKMNLSILEQLFGFGIKWTDGENSDNN